MKLKKISLAVCGALLLGGNGLAANAYTYDWDSLTTIEEGTEFTAWFSCLMTERTDNDSPMYSYSFTVNGVAGSTIEADIPDLPGYRFVKADAHGKGNIRIEGSKLYLDADIESILYFGSGSGELNGIDLFYEIDPEYPLVAGWNQLFCPIKRDIAWYYCNEDLSFRTGLQTIDGKLYYLYEDGHMAQSEYVLLGDDWSETRFFGSSGALKTGWIRQNIYTMGHLTGETWYYGDPETGYLKRNEWLEENGRYYYFQGFNMVSSAWIETNGERYYVTNSGAMATSRWIHYQGKDYYVDETGKMLKNQWVGQYWVDENGVWDQTKTR